LSESCDVGLNVLCVCCVSGMLNSPAMQSMMQQLMSNPQVTQSVMQSPYMQSAMQSIASNPEMARQVSFTESQELALLLWA